MATHSFLSPHAGETFSGDIEMWNEPVAHSESFVALPSIGSLVPGWLLIAPKSHVLNFGRIEAEQRLELNIFLEKVVGIVETAFGEAATFEHGPAHRTSEVGCGVDHAHLHVVPTGCPLFESASQSLHTLNWDTITGLKDLSALSDASTPYLYLHQPKFSKSHLIGTGDIPSQFFRRLIAEWQGCPDDFDWKRNPRFENIRETRQTLEKMLDNEAEDFSAYSHRLQSELSLTS